MEAMQAEDAMHGQDQAGMEDMGGPAPLTVLQASVPHTQADKVTNRQQQGQTCIMSVCVHAIPVAITQCCMLLLPAAALGPWCARC